MCTPISVFQARRSGHRYPVSRCYMVIQVVLVEHCVSSWWVYTFLFLGTPYIFSQSTDRDVINYVPAWKMGGGAGQRKRLESTDLNALGPRSCVWDC